MAENIKSYPNLIDGNWMTLSDTRLEDRNPAEHKEIKEGTRLLLGGEVDGEKGYFAQATIFDCVEPTMRIAQEEIFGPVIGIIRAKDINDAIEKTNAIPFGLCAGIVTNDLKAAFAFAN